MNELYVTGFVEDSSEQCTVYRKDCALCFSNCLYGHRPKLDKAS